MKPGTVLRLQFAESVPGYTYAAPEAAALQALQDTLPTLDLPRADSDSGEIPVSLMTSCQPCSYLESSA